MNGFVPKQARPAFSFGLGLLLGLGLGARPAGAEEILTFHRNPQRTGWDDRETQLTPQSVRGAAFGMIWESPQLDLLEGKPPRLYASPLYVESVRLTTGPNQGRDFQTIYTATSNGFVYAINAFQNGSVSAGTILWRTSLVRPEGEFDGVKLGVLSTPVIDLAQRRIYVTCGAAVGTWKVYALDLGSGRILEPWPLTIDASTLATPGLDQNPPPSDAPKLVNERKKAALGYQRGALNLSPDGSRLYITFGESLTGWIVAVDTKRAQLATAFATVAYHRNFSGGVWGAAGASVDPEGGIYIATGTDFGGFVLQPHDWGQSVLKFTDSAAGGLKLAGTYTPFNYGGTGAADIDLGSGGVCLLPELASTRTTSPDLLALGGKQGNVYLVNRRSLPGRLDQRPAPSPDSASDQSLLSPDLQPQFGKRGPLNVFGPYTETTAAVDHARSRSIPAYFHAATGEDYLFVSGSSKSIQDYTKNIPPSLARLKVVTGPGQPAFLRVDQLETTRTFENPGSPVITSNGGRDAIVWVLDENALRSALLDGPSSPRPKLYAFDAMSLEPLWESSPNQLFPSGKYNEPGFAHGSVFVGTDRIQAFGLRPAGMKFPEFAAPAPATPENSALGQLAQGGELYKSGGSCVACHQADGQGVPGVFPPLAGSEWVNGPEEPLIALILFGLRGPMHTRGKVYNAAAMPGFGNVKDSAFAWSDRKVAQVANYIRQSWGNQAPEIYLEKVAAVRVRLGDHAPFLENELAPLK